MKAVPILFAVTLFSMPVYASKTLVTNYADLVKAVESGEDVRAIVHVDKCRVIGDAKQPSLKQSGASTRFNFNVYSHYKVKVNNLFKETVATSMTMLIEHPQGFLNSYGRLRIFEDNSAELHTAYYDPVTNQKKYSKDYSCQVSNGADENAIMIFNFNG